MVRYYDSQLRSIDEGEWSWIINDVRRKLVDPKPMISGRSGYDADAQRRVFANDGFATTIISTITAIGELQSTEPAFVAAGCSKGDIRSQIVGNVTQDYLNSIYDVDGERVYNCMLWHMAEFYKDYKDVYEQTVTWCGEPWTIVGAEPLTSGIWNRIEYHSAITCGEGALEFEKIYDHLTTMYPGSPGPKDTSSALAVVPAAPVELPTWFTSESKMQNWWCVLDDRGVDDGCRMELMALSQLSDAGYRAANNVLSKMFKAESEKTHIGNYSAFLHTRIQNARNAINDACGEGWHPSKRAGGKDNERNAHGGWKGNDWSSSSWKGGTWASNKRTYDEIEETVPVAKKCNRNML